MGRGYESPYDEASVNMKKNPLSGSSDYGQKPLSQSNHRYSITLHREMYANQFGGFLRQSCL